MHLVFDKLTLTDCHCHAGLGDGLAGPWDTRADLGAYLRRCDAAGIGRSVVFSAFHSDYREGNARVAELVARHRGRLIGFVFLDARMPRSVMEAELRRYVLGQGFAGIKLHRHDAPISRAVCELAAAFRVPVLYDLMGDVAPIELFAREYRQVNFIIPHLGSFDDDWKAQLALIDHLQRHPNVYADSAGVRRFDMLVEAVRRAGPEKLLFGSDGPWLHPGVELAKVQAIGLPDAQYSLIAGGNLLRLLGKRARGRRGMTISSDSPRRLPRHVGTAAAGSPFP